MNLLGPDKDLKEIITQDKGVNIDKFFKPRMPDKQKAIVKPIVAALDNQVNKPAINAKAIHTSTIVMNFCMNKATSWFGIINFITLSNHLGM